MVQVDDGSGNSLECDPFDFAGITPINERTINDFESIEYGFEGAAIWVRQQGQTTCTTTANLVGRDAIGCAIPNDGGWLDSSDGLGPSANYATGYKIVADQNRIRFTARTKGWHQGDLLLDPPGCIWGTTNPFIYSGGSYGPALRARIPFRVDHDGAVMVDVSQLIAEVGPFGIGCASAQVHASWYLDDTQGNVIASQSYDINLSEFDPEGGTIQQNWETTNRCLPVKAGVDYMLTLDYWSDNGIATGIGNTVTSASCELIDYRDFFEVTLSYVGFGDITFDDLPLKPDGEDTTIARVALPDGYSRPIKWRLDGDDLGAKLVQISANSAKITSGLRSGTLWVVAEDDEPGATSPCIFAEAPMPITGTAECATCDSASAGTCSAASSFGQLGSLDFEISVGNDKDGKPIGGIRVHADRHDPPSEPHPDLATPRALQFHHVHPDVEVYRDFDPATGNGAIIQIATPQVLVNIDDENPGSLRYWLRIYESPPEGWAGNGPYATAGLNHLASWRVQWYANGLTFRKYDVVAGAENHVADYSYTYNETESSWRLVTSGMGGPFNFWGDWRTEVQKPTGQLRLYTQQGQDSSKYRRIIQETLWEDTGWGEPVTTRVVDLTGSTSNPSGLTTTFDYYDGVAEPEDGNLKSRVNPDGSWTWYNYSYSPTTDAKTVTVISGLGDQGFLSDPDPADPNVRSVASTFGDHGRMTNVTEKVGGTIVAVTNYSYQFGAGGELLSRTIDRCSDSACGSALTTTITYDPNDEDKVLSIQFPDGRLDTYEYDGGTYTPPSSFTPGPGYHERMNIIHGTVANPQGVDVRTTMETMIRDWAGNVVMQETYVRSSGAFVRIDWVSRVYDGLGRQLSELRADGSLVENEWGTCCSISETTDASGVVTETGYDTLGRIVVSDRPQINAFGGYPAIPQVKIFYDYDLPFYTTPNLVREHVEITTIAGNLETVALRDYDMAGRLLRTADDMEPFFFDPWRETNYEYSLGGRTVKVIAPGGIETITDNYVDGRVKQISQTTPGQGTVILKYYEYGKNLDGSQWSTVYSGPGGLSSPRWVKTTSDMLGRTIEVRRSGYGADVVTTNEYAPAGTVAAGKLVKTMSSGLADTIYEYDSVLGELFRTGLDIDGGGLSTGATSLDRITDTLSEFVNDSGWWQETTTWVYKDGSASPIFTGRTRSRTGEWRVANVTSYTEQEDAKNNLTVSQTTNDRTNVVVTSITDFNYDPAGAPVDDAHSISRAGLLQETMSRSGAKIEYLYDALGRRIETKGRAQASIQTTFDSYGRVWTVETAINATSTAKTTYSYYDETSLHFGGLQSIENANGPPGFTYYDYNDRGQITRVWGDVPQPVEVAYDDYGQRTSLKTFRTGTGWAGPTWPGGTADETTWTYDPPTGLLTAKTYADGKGISYDDYTVEGRLKNRTWARGGGTLTTTYSWSPTTGELTNIIYAGTTPDVTFTYYRTGQLKEVTDAVGTRSFNYDPTTLELTDENLPAGAIYASAATIARTYDPLAYGQLDSLQIGSDYLATYQTDPVTGRLDRVTGPGLPTGGANSHGAWYTYLSDSDLIDRVDFKDAVGTRLLYSQRGYDQYRDLLQDVENWKDDSQSPLMISKYDYSNDVLGRREHVINTGDAFTTSSQVAHSEYTYNPRNELTDQKRYQGSDPANPGPQIGPETFGYIYDNIGNRTESTVDIGSNKITSDYTENQLNQYTRLQVHTGDPNNPIAAELFQSDDDGNRSRTDLVADMNCDGLFNGADTDPFFLAIGDPVAYQQQYPGCDIMRADINNDGLVNGGDINGFFSLLGSSGGGVPALSYTWDAENRLIKMFTSGPPGPDDKKLEFDYDYMGRRVKKRVVPWNPNLNEGEGGWDDGNPDQVRKFVWARWLLLLELDGLNGDAVVRKYTWGLDLSNSLQGAGGIGGLLATLDANGTATTSDDKSYIYFYDGAGNVGQLIEHDGMLAAHYEYTPYGDTVAAAGPYAKTNPFRFSTKYLDTTEDGLQNEVAWFYYFGYRYYSPRLGRWIKRDPIGALGGINLYEYVNNIPLSAIDPIGLLSIGAAEDVVTQYLNAKNPIAGLGVSEEVTSETCIENMLNLLRNQQGLDGLLKVGLSTAFAPLNALPAKFAAKLTVAGLEAIANAVLTGTNPDDLLELIQTTFSTLTPDELKLLEEVVTEQFKALQGKGLGNAVSVRRASKPILTEGTTISCVFLVTAETRHGILGEHFEKGHKFTLFVSCDYTCTRGELKQCPCGCKGSFFLNVQGVGQGSTTIAKIIKESITFYQQK